ncbi:MAG: hypothetical protein ABIY52_13775 [Gemmatimonadaceae bacterium]
MNARIAVAMAALLAASACKWGMRPENYPPANMPAGASVAVRVRDEGADRVGELFAVDSVGVTIYNRALQRIAWSRLGAMDVKDLGSGYDVSFGEIPDATKRSRIAAVSRFPQGLSPDLLRSVLAKLRLSQLEEVR